MSAKPNATVVGIFVLGALACTVLGLVFLGQSLFRSSSYRFITYFDETVSGLEIGAAVKFRGVKIGQVTELKIFLGETDGEGVSSRIPVIYEVNRKNLDEFVGSLIDLSKPDELRRYIDDGLRARLATSSLITGLMYVELDIVDPLQYPAEYYSAFDYLYEIPTFKGPLAEISDNVSSAIKRFNSVDLEMISIRLIELLETLNQEVKAADLPRLSQSLQGAAGSISTLASTPEIPRILKELEKTLREYKVLAVDLKEAIDPTASEFRAALQQLTRTLAGLEDTTLSLNAMVRPQSSIRNNLDDTLSSLAMAAESLRALADFLERNPGALISGRRPSQD